MANELREEGGGGGGRRVYGNKTKQKSSNDCSYTTLNRATRVILFTDQAISIFPSQDRFRRHCSKVGGGGRLGRDKLPDRQTGSERQSEYWSRSELFRVCVMVGGVSFFFSISFFPNLGDANLGGCFSFWLALCSNLDNVCLFRLRTKM